MEIPWLCSSCRWENWIDIEHLSRWPLDGVISALGFICSYCGMWEAISYTTVSLQEAERKLTRYAPGHPKFPYLMGRLVAKQTGVNERGEAYGKSIRQNLAVP